MSIKKYQYDLIASIFGIWLHVISNRHLQRITSRLGIFISLLLAFVKDCMEFAGAVCVCGYVARQWHTLKVDRNQGDKARQGQHSNCHSPYMSCSGST